MKALKYSIFTASVAIFLAGCQPASQNISDGTLDGAVVLGTDNGPVKKDVPAKQQPAAATQATESAATTNEIKTELLSRPWEMNPPKSVVAARVTVPHDDGAVFKRYCSVCHGPQGKGDGQYYSDELPSRPANLTDEEKLKELTDEHLTNVITGGSTSVGKSPLCPPWGRVLTKDQIAETVAYIRKLPSLAAQQPDASSQ